MLSSEFTLSDYIDADADWPYIAGWQIADWRSAACCEWSQLGRRCTRYVGLLVYFNSCSNSLFLASALMFECDKMHSVYAAAVLSGLLSEI